MPTRALITGITGQDGAYLAKFLLEKGYEVHGMVRRSSHMERPRIDALEKYRVAEPARLFLHYGELSDSGNLIHLLYQIAPDEIYNLAGQSSVRVSFEMAEYTCESNAMGVIRLLEGLRKSGLGKKTRFYQASSSEMFGRVKELPITETTPLQPRSPYACAKAMAHNMAAYYRDAHGLFTCTGILFNHESPLRSEAFVTRKITRAVGRIAVGLQEKLQLGDLTPRRDWGYAPEFVDAMWRMLQQDRPGDYVIATNEAHAVAEFAESAFAEAGLDWKKHVEFDARQVRPTELDEVRGDYSKAQRELGWEPTVRLSGLVKIMVQHDLALAQAEKEAGPLADKFSTARA